MYAADPTAENVASVDGVGYPTLQDAVNAADGKVVELLSDVTLTNKVEVTSGTVILDLKGHTIAEAITDSKTTYLLKIASRNELTIQDTSESGTGKISGDIGKAILVNGTLNLRSGTIENSGEMGILVNGQDARLNMTGGLALYSEDCTEFVSGGIFNTPVSESLCIEGYVVPTQPDENGNYVVAPKMFTMTFDSAGGSAVNPITTAFGTAFTAPAAPERPGYTFAGWYAANSDTEFDFVNKAQVAAKAAGTETHKSGSASYELVVTDHKYDAIVVVPTCTEKGYTKHTCSICKDTYTDEVTEALGHKFKDGVCTVCGEKDSQYNPKPNPKPDPKPIVPEQNGNNNNNSNNSNNTPSAVKTGDKTPTAMWVGIVVISGLILVGAIVVFVRKRKTR